MNQDCIFCKIASKQIPAKIEYENDDCIVFHDINPRAKIHMLVIPKKHIATLNDLSDADGQLAGKMMMAAQTVARKSGMDSYRLLMSVGKAAGQEIFHMHLHVMSPI